MPTYATPEPITASLEPGIGDVTIVASERADTVVEIRPTNPSDASDVDAAERTTVDFSGGTLTVKGPRMSPFSFSNKTRSIHVTVALPSGSHVHGSTGMGDLTATGRLGDVSYKTGMGHLQVEEVGALTASSGTGNLLGTTITGRASVSTGSGRLQLGALADGGVLKNSNGTTVVGLTGGPTKVRAANGDITVEVATADVEAKTARGTVRVLDATRGSLTLETAMGEVEVGIHEGSAAWLDVTTKFGRVRNEMAAATAPAEGADKVEVHATTGYGDVVVRRA